MSGSEANTKQLFLTIKDRQVTTFGIYCSNSKWIFHLLQLKEKNQNVVKKKIKLILWLGDDSWHPIVKIINSSINNLNSQLGWSQIMINLLATWHHLTRVMCLAERHSHLEFNIWLGCFLYYNPIDKNAPQFWSWTNYGITELHSAVGNIYFHYFSQSLQELKLFLNSLVITFHVEQV